jgi:hypothetical protein
MKRHWQISLALAVLIAGCSAHTIAEYDENIDRGAAGLHAKFNALFDDLQRTAGTPDGGYDRFAAQYDQLLVDIAALQSHVALQSDNQLTNTSLTLLDDNLHQLEVAHRDGLTAGEIPILRKLFDTQLRSLVQLEVAKKRDAGQAEVPR